MHFYKIQKVELMNFLLLFLILFLLLVRRCRGSPGRTLKQVSFQDCPSSLTFPWF